MLDSLRIPLGVDRRKALGEEYLHYFQRRNGRADFATLRLERRDTLFEAIAVRRCELSQRSAADVSQAVFDELVEGRDSAMTSRRTEWLVTLARANQAEAWGVDYLLDHARRSRAVSQLQGDPRALADIEEGYHTRILREIVGAFGLTFTLAPPPAPVRYMIKSLARSPRRIRNVILLAGELVGTIAFLRMREEAFEVVDTQDERQFALDLLDEILIDEIGHVCYLLASLNAAQCALLRLALPVVEMAIKRSYVDGDPETAAYYGRSLRSYSFNLFPEELIDRSFVPREFRRPRVDTIVGDRIDG